MTTFSSSLNSVREREGGPPLLNGDDQWRCELSKVLATCTSHIKGLDRHSCKLLIIIALWDKEPQWIFWKRVFAKTQGLYSYGKEGMQLSSNFIMAIRSL